MGATRATTGQGHPVLAKDAIELRDELFRRKSHFKGTEQVMPAILEMMINEGISLPRPRLFRALQWFSHCECADPRDKVYSLLGMIKHQNVMDIDYSLTPTEVLHANIETILELEQADYGLKQTLVNLARHMGLAWEIQYVEYQVNLRFPEWIGGKIFTTLWGAEGDFLTADSVRALQEGTSYRGMDRRFRKLFCTMLPCTKTNSCK